MKENILYKYRLRIAEGGVYKFSEIRTAIITGEDVMFSISPNPVSGEDLKIVLNIYEGDAVVTLVNFLGQPVYNSLHKLDNSGRLMLHIGAQPAGLYLLYVKTVSGFFTEKVIIK